MGALAAGSPTPLACSYPARRQLSEPHPVWRRRGLERNSAAMERQRLGEGGVISSTSSTPARLPAGFKVVHGGPCPSLRGGSACPCLGVTQAHAGARMGSPSAWDAITGPRLVHSSVRRETACCARRRELQKPDDASGREGGRKGGREEGMVGVVRERGEAMGCMHTRPSQRPCGEGEKRGSPPESSEFSFHDSLGGGGVES